MMTIFVLVLVIVVLAMMQSGIDLTTVNTAIDSLNWSKYSNSTLGSIQNSIDSSSNYITKTALTITQKAVDFFGYTIFEVSKLAMKLARDHPEIINYKLLMFLLIVSLLAPIIYPAFIIIVSLILIIKEAIQKRKERKELKINQDEKSFV